MKAPKKAMKQVEEKSQIKARKSKSSRRGPVNTATTSNKTVMLKIPKLTIPKKPFTKSELLNVLAEQSNLSRKEVRGVWEAIKAIAKAHLVKNGPGQLTLPGLCKLTAVTKPATKARKGRNPLSGEEIMIKAKPARRVIKVKALKKFKAELE